MSYRISLSSRAERDLKKLSGRTYLRVQAAIRDLSDNSRPPGCRKLAQVNEWRIRVGDYRIRYRIDDTHQEIIVTSIRHRREVYR
ncbi:MAG: type II toxin-antitoxin system RelE family toxin [Candidatus Bipolaricaulia bacterium]